VAGHQDFDYLFNERVAIKEYDGKMPREQAEREARAEISAMMPLREELRLEF
jgi:hypothetical protein